MLKEQEMTTTQANYQSYYQPTICIWRTAKKTEVFYLSELHHHLLIKLSTRKQIKALPKTLAYFSPSG